MLKTAVNNGAEQLRFKEKVSEARAMNGYIGTFHLLLVGRGAAFWESLGLIVLLIVQKFIINVILCHLDHNWGGEETGKTKCTCLCFFVTLIVHKKKLSRNLMKKGHSSIDGI